MEINEIQTTSLQHMISPPCTGHIEDIHMNKYKMLDKPRLLICCQRREHWFMVRTEIYQCSAGLSIVHSMKTDRLGIVS